MEATAPFALHIVWHPNYDIGIEVANRLFEHFGAKHNQRLVGDTGVRVVYRQAVAPGSQAPLPIDWQSGNVTAAVILVDNELASDPAWTKYAREIAREADRKGFSTGIFPVVMESEALDNIGLTEQALRWDRWDGEYREREQRLLRDLTYEFIRMLRHYLTQLRYPNEGVANLESYLRNVQVFLSHSKHDDHGESIAREVRDWLHHNSALASFLDIQDIPAGLPFREVLLHQIENNIIMVVYTDSYSSREWCRREVIEAKKQQVPMIVFDCLHGIDPRSIPYMGNVPFVRMDSDQGDQIGTVIGCLLDEVFWTYIWFCSVERFRAEHPDVLFMARPPELIALATLPDHQGEADSTIVYPDPPLGTDEAQLFLKVAPNVRTHTLSKWMEEVR